MTQVSHARAAEVFDAACELSGAARAAYIERECAGNPTLRAAVERLLAHDSDSIEFLGEREVASGRDRLHALLDDDHDPLLGGGAEAQEESRPRVGPYRVLRRIGEGGMGVVYEAEQDAPRRRVALKISRPIHDSDKRLRRFRQETEVLGRLEHPGIARIFSAGTFEHRGTTRPYFAMEFIEGVSLTAYAERAKLSTRARLALLAQVCEAVQHAHDKGVIHRDLKPDNVLVRPGGTPAVLDFGVARLSDPSTLLTTMRTEDGELLGTLAYMAPEQLGGDPEALTGRADVYALGVLAYELLAARLPHDVSGLPLGAAARILAEREAPRLGLFDPALGGDVETMVGKALSLEPARRYASPAAFARDLAAYLANRPIAARPPSRIYLVGKFARRHRGLVAGAAAAFVAIAVGLGVALVALGRESEQRAVADGNALLAREGERRAIGAHYRAVQEKLDQGELLQAGLVHARAAVSSAEAPVDPRVHWDERFLESVLPTMVPARWDLRRAAWMDEEHLVAAALSGGGIAVVDVDSGREVRRLLAGRTMAWARPLPEGAGREGTERSDAERYVVGVASDPLELVLVRLADGAVVHRQFASGPGVGASDLDGVIDGEGRARTFERITGERVAVCYRDGIERARVEFLPGTNYFTPSPDGAHLTLWSTTGQMRVHDADTGALRGELSGMPRGDGARFAYRRNGRELLTADADMTLVAIDLERAERVRRWESIRMRRHVNLELSRDETLLAQAPAGRLELWDLERGELVSAGDLVLASREDHTVAFSPSTRRMLISTYDVAGVVVEREHGLLPADALGTDRDPRATTYRGHTRYVYHFAVSPDGRLAASLSQEESALHVWDLFTAETVATLPMRKDDRWDGYRRGTLIAFAPDGRRLCFTGAMPGTEETQLVQWDLWSGAVESEPRAPGLSASSALSFLDRYLEVLGEAPVMRLGRTAYHRGDGTALGAQEPQRLDVPVGERWREARWGNDELALGLSPDGRAVVIAGSRSLSIESADGRERYARYPGKAFAVAWSPDGKLIAAGYPNGRIGLFDGEFFSELYSFPAHEKYVFSLAWTPDSTRLVSCSGDATVRVWDPRPRAERETDYAGYAALLDELRALGDGDLRARFASASSIEERGALVRLALERRTAEEARAAAEAGDAGSGSK